MYTYMYMYTCEYTLHTAHSLHTLYLYRIILHIYHRNRVNQSSSHIHTTHTVSLKSHPRPSTARLYQLCTRRTSSSVLTPSSNLTFTLALAFNFSFHSIPDTRTNNTNTILPPPSLSPYICRRRAGQVPKDRNTPDRRVRKVDRSSRGTTRSRPRPRNHPSSSPPAGLSIIRKPGKRNHADHIQHPIHSHLSAPSVSPSPATTTTPTTPPRST